MSTTGLRVQWKIALAALLALSGCGGDGGDAAPPVTPTYTVGGAATGLTGSGLVLTLNGGSDLAVSGSANFTFPAALPGATSYTVAVKTQPVVPSQTCVVTGNTGTVTNAAVTNVAVSCTTNTYGISGSVSGLAGAGLILALNGSSDLAVGVNGNVAFASAVASGSSYAVTVQTQPVNPSQTCVITNGSGTVGSGLVSNVSVGCTTNRYAVSGTVSGLAGAGLVLRLNGTTNLPAAANGAFAFPTTLSSGSAYTVIVSQQPTSPFQTCTVTDGAGVLGGSATSIAVNCTTDAYAVGGSVSGLTGSGLVLQLSSGQEVTVNGDGNFLFPTLLLRGVSFSVTVKTQTPTYRELCAVSHGSGVNLSADVTSIKVDCAVVPGFVYLIDENDNILEYGIQPVTGALMPVGPVGSLAGYVRNFAVTPDRHTLYASVLHTSQVHAFSVDQSKGTLTVVGAPLLTGTSGSGADALAITPSGKFLYVSNIYDATVTLSSIDPTTGALTFQGVATTPPVSGVTSRQDLAITPDGAFLYVLSVAMTGSPSSLTVYSINPTTGALSAGATLAPLAAEGLAIDPLGRFLYLRNSVAVTPFTTSSATVSPYTINSGTGALTAVGVDTTVISNGSRMLIDPSGNYAYLLGNFNFSPVHNHIDTFGINQATGALTVLGSPVLVPGDPYLGFAIDATGKFLFTRNFRADGAVDPGNASVDGSTFRISQSGPTTGRPSAAGSGASTPRGEAALAVVQ